MTDHATLTDRLLALWDHLGLTSAHVAVQFAPDMAGFASRHAERIAGLLLCDSTSTDPAAFVGLAQRLTIVAGDGGVPGKVAAAAVPQLSGCRHVVLAGYAGPVWADCVTENRDAVVSALCELAGDASVPAGAAAEGSHAGITYRIVGHGPALVLFPLFLSAQQWDAAIPALAERFSVIVLGGRHLGGVAALESRATSATYIGMVSSLVQRMAPGPGQSILEMGCGSGALIRHVARLCGPSHPLTAMDLNPFLLREAAVLAAEDGVAGQISFRQGNAEALPFDDASFDHAFSVTVLEECDANQALRELCRVVRPGGSVGVIVRAGDMAHPWNIDLPEALLLKVNTRPVMVGPAGVSDRSLYQRAADAGLRELACFPMLASVGPEQGVFFRYGESGVLARLSAEETALWQAARGVAEAKGIFFSVWPHHCVVGRVPG